MRIKISIDGSICWMHNTLQFMSTMWGDVSTVITSVLVVIMHNGHIGRCYWHKIYQYGHRPILCMCVNPASTMFSFLSWVRSLPICCRDSFMKNWQHLLAKTTATCSLRHPENERQRSVSSYRIAIFCNEGIARIFMCITLLLTALLGKNTKYGRWNTATKLIDIPNCSTSTTTILVTENPILTRYY